MTILSDGCKLVTIYGNGSIDELYGISCPVTIPVEMSIDTISKLVNKGFKVYEVNPRNKKEKVRLTATTVRKTNFSQTGFIHNKKSKVENDTKVDEVTSVEPAKTISKDDETPTRIISSDFSK